MPRNSGAFWIAMGTPAASATLPNKATRSAPEAGGRGGWRMSQAAPAPAAARAASIVSGRLPSDDRHRHRQAPRGGGEGPVEKRAPFLAPELLHLGPEAKHRDALGPCCDGCVDLRGDRIGAQTTLIVEERIEHRIGADGRHARSSLPPAGPIGPLCLT